MADYNLNVTGYGGAPIQIIFGVNQNISYSVQLYLGGTSPIYSTTYTGVATINITPPAGPAHYVLVITPWSAAGGQVNGNLLIRDNNIAINVTDAGTGNVSTNIALTLDLNLPNHIQINSY